MFYKILQQLPIALGQIFFFALICLIMGTVLFVVGELLPRRNFDYTAFPYRSAKWENDGRVYNALKIQRWKDHVPDMSKYIKSAFSKKIVSYRDPEYLRQLILETCVAELVHVVLILLSPVFLLLLEDLYGTIAMIVYILGNLPFILIQRYNRPRLVILRDRQLATYGNNAYA